MEKQEKRFGQALGILRPPILVALLLLVLYGVHMHQQWMDNTCLGFAVALRGKLKCQTQY
jgi:hypothetical protein